MADITVTGNEAYFNEDAKFFKDVYIYGKLYYDFGRDGVVEFDDVTINGDLTVLGNTYIAGDLDAGIITARRRLDVGIGGTTLRADAENGGKVGIGTTNPRQQLDVIGTVTVSERIGVGTVEPQQRIDVAGSIKIDENIYDSANNPAKNGYFLTRDERGIRWLPLVAEARTDNGITTALGIGTDGIFVLDEMVPLYPA